MLNSIVVIVRLLDWMVDKILKFGKFNCPAAAW